MKSNYVLCTGVILVNIRCLIHLSMMHASLRKMMVIITDSATELVAFLAIIFILVCIFGVGQLVVSTELLTLQPGQERKVTF